MPVLVGVVALVAARAAMLPGVGFWDTGELQAVGPLMGTAHPTGFPTWVLLGWLASVVLAPFGEPAFRMNLLAGLCLAVAAGVTVDLGRALTRSTALGVAAGLGLALTDIAWSIGTHAEAHALHLALVAVLLRLLVAWEDDRSDRALVAAAVVFGLAAGNHSLTLLLAPAIGLYVLAVSPGILRRPRFVATCFGALALTLVAVYLELPLRAGPFRAPLVYGHPETWEGFWYIVLAQQFQGSLVEPFADLSGKLAELAARTMGSFGALAPLVPIAFLATALRRPRYALLTGVATGLTVFFAASYENADIGRYYLVPALMAWTWLAILGRYVVDLVRAATGRIEVEHEPWMADAATRRATATGPALAAALVVAGALLLPAVLDAPRRFRTVDRSRDVAAARWVDRALDEMGRDAIIISWWSYSTPLWYAQHVEGRRPDISIVDDRTRLDEGLGDIYAVIDANLPTRPVYVIRADPREVAGIEERYVVEHVDGPTAAFLTRVVAPREGGA